MTTQHRYVGDNNALRDILPALWHDTASHAHFSSPEALCQFVEATPADRHWEPTAWGDDLAFTGTIDMPQAIALCRAGWPEGAARAARLRDKIIAANPTMPRLARWDVAGAYPSVARALSGNPMNMRRMDSARSRRKPVLTLIHHMGGNAQIKATSFQNKAAVVAAIVDAIEAADYQVELIAVSVSQESQTGKAIFVHETAFTVKQPGQPLDIGKLAFSIGHTSAFRRLAFACRSGDDFNRPLTGTLGQTVDYRSRPDGAYILPSLMGREPLFANEQVAATRGLQFFLNELRKQDCPAFPTQEAAA